MQILLTEIMKYQWHHEKAMKQKYKKYLNSSLFLSAQFQVIGFDQGTNLLTYHMNFSA